MIVFYLQQNLWGKNRDQQFQKVVDSSLIIILLKDINGGIYKMFYDSFLCQSHSDESAQFYIDWAESKSEISKDVYDYGQENV